MRDYAAVLRTSLQQRGYSLTAARTAVFQALQGEEPQTMRELSAGLAQRLTEPASTGQSYCLSV
jgi:Fe2+ or Zn2+ uptake regulation protein